MEILMSLFGIGFFVFIIWEIRKGEKQVASTCKWCDAGDALSHWKQEHPGACPEDWPTGRKLLEEHRIAYEEFVRLHHFLGP